MFKSFTISVNDIRDYEDRVKKRSIQSEKTAIVAKTLIIHSMINALVVSLHMCPWAAGLDTTSETLQHYHYKHKTPLVFLT